MVIVFLYDMSVSSSKAGVNPDIGSGLLFFFLKEWFEMMIRKRKIQLMGIFLFIVMLVASACSQPAGVSDEAGSEALAQQDSQESTEDKQEGKHGPGGSGGMKPGGRMGSADKSGDTKLQAMISEVKDKFTTGEYTDSETGITVPYDI